MVILGFEIIFLDFKLRDFFNFLVYIFCVINFFGFYYFLVFYYLVLFALFYVVCGLLVIVYMFGLLFDCYDFSVVIFYYFRVVLVNIIGVLVREVKFDFLNLE